MVNICIVSGCKRESYPGCGMSFHRIPDDEEWRALWITSMKLDNNVSKFACVCSLHFNQDDYLTKKKLKPEAVPSVFPEVFPSKKNTVLSIENIKLESSIEPSISNNITQAETCCEREESSNEYDVEVFGEQPYIKVKQEESSTQKQEIKKKTLEKQNYDEILRF